MALQPWMYVILLGLVFVVYARFLPKQHASQPKNNVVQEIEDTIEHFASEMDEQNQAILTLFTKTKQDYEIELAKLSGRLESLEKQRNELTHELTQANVNQQLNMKAMSELHPPVTELPVQHKSELPVEEVEPESELPDVAAVLTGLSMKSRYAELFALHDQGKGVEAIAKKLGMNKGEVSLILQLSKQEEQSRV
ncbi:DUF6115 domain-containing protein [Paenibacillus hexagrammi]|uniref:Uncharacterized protein n=1 Tax=Paenibacillus hexagrammi TaxID=2908839 RepID=A0ABY3SPN7_9BACL|nr:hypothetical protein [Paenibacillus sp. YPD9-1]UJF35370.1 hypothetical protein L0M14_09815 [Paenibacillus sp. YPD9-1]